MENPAGLAKALLAFAAQARQIHDRVTRLRRWCRHTPEEARPTDPLAEQMPLLAGYTAASIQKLMATAPGAGHPVRRLRASAVVVNGEQLRCARRGEFLPARQSRPGRPSPPEDSSSFALAAPPPSRAD
jgi:hypothetical protein